MILPWLKKRQQGGGRVGVYVDASGVAAVYSHAGRPQIWQHMAPEDRDFTAALAGFVNQHKISGSACEVVLPTSDYQLLQTESPQVDAAEWAGALRWMVKDLLSYPVDQAVIDGFSLPDDAFRGRQKMAYAVALKQTQLLAVRDMINEADLELDYIGISELAAQKIMRLTPPQKDASRAMVYLGERKGFINIEADSAIYLARSIGQGLSNFADELGQADLLLDVQRSVDYYESQMGKGGVMHLTMAPVGDVEEHMRRQFADSLRAQVSFCDLNELLQLETAMTAAEQQQLFLATAASLGRVSQVEQAA